jgi:hypothetical protein
MTSQPDIASRGLVLAAALTLSAMAASAAERTVAIPFEADRAQLRGDRLMLKLNDDAAAIPATRIRGLPVVNGRIGDRADLDNGLQVYFPDGRIVRAEMRVQKFRTDDSAAALPDPAYRVVAEFDKVLGPVCARTSNASVAGHSIEMRITAQKVISIVERASIPPGNAMPENVSYRVISALDVAFLAEQGQAYELYDTCTHKHGKVVKG